MILLHLPLDRGGIIWEWIWNTDEIGAMAREKIKKKGVGEINFRGKGLAHLMNSCSFSLSLSFPRPFLRKEEKDEKRNPHTVTVREALCGQSITNQSLKVLVLLLEDVLHYLQTFNVGMDVREKVCVCVCVCVCRGNYSWPFTLTAPEGTRLNLQRRGCWHSKVITISSNLSFCPFHAHAHIPSS